MGDSGVVVQQEAAVPLHKVLPWTAFSNVARPLGLQVVGGLDVGVVRFNASGLGTGMVGGVLGVRHKGATVSAEWMMAKLIRASTGISESAPVIYWTMAFQLA
jgi:hemolysin activation/secretion protein